MKVNLGDKVRDTLTGLTGTVVARTEWMYGCVRVTVQPAELKDGKPVETSTIDEPQCEILASGELRTKTARHGPRPEPRRQSDPR